jgi:hypothetical protein
MILTQDLCQLQDNSMLTALTRQQVTLRVDIARVMAAAATRRYALKRGNRFFFSISISAVRLLVCPYELPRKCERHHAFDGIVLYCVLLVDRRHIAFESV